METLSQQMQVKMRMLAQKTCCFQETFISEFLKTAKSATVEYLKKSSKEEKEGVACELGVIGVE